MFSSIGLPRTSNLDSEDDISSAANAAELRRQMRDQSERLRGAYEELEWQKEELMLLEKQASVARKREGRVYIARRIWLPVRLAIEAWKQSIQKTMLASRSSSIWLRTSQVAKRKVEQVSHAINAKAAKGGRLLEWWWVAWRIIHQTLALAPQLQEAEQERTRLAWELEQSREQTLLLKEDLAQRGPAWELVGKGLCPPPLASREELAFRRARAAHQRGKLIAELGELRRVLCTFWARGRPYVVQWADGRTEVDASAVALALARAMALPLLQLPHVLQAHYNGMDKASPALWALLQATAAPSACEASSKGLASSATVDLGRLLAAAALLHAGEGDMPEYQLRDRCAREQ